MAPNRPAHAVAVCFRRLPRLLQGRLPRLLTLLALVTAQVVAAGRCAACDTGGCAACTPCCAAPAGVAHESGGCASGAPAPHASCCSAAAGDEHAETPRSCTCQWEPRDDTPLAPAAPVAIDLDAVSQAGRAELDDDSAAARHTHAAAAHDIPQRPLRILLGVWRN